MLVLSQGPMSDSYLCSAAQDSRGSSWMLVLSNGPMSDSCLCSGKGDRGRSRMIVIPKWIYERLLPVQRT